MRDYLTIANQYIADVASGKQIACVQVKQACQRQADNLANGVTGYRFDPEKATRVCKFLELLPHIKGEWAGQPIKLEPWQIFIATTIFGWVDDNGYRRFKIAYIEVPRKNAKSTFSSGIALYCLGFDDEGGAEVFSAATTRDQARIVFQDAQNMVKRSSGLRKRGFSTTAHTIFLESSASSMRALARDQGGNLDGLNVHCAIVDELHAHKVRDVWDVLETATGARRQPLIWAITTAGFNRTGICYEQRNYASKLLQGVSQDEEYFGIIYTADEGDDWTDETTWIKANPNWGVSVNPDDIRRKARKAMEVVAAQNNFLTKHLNIWVNANTAWLDVRQWDACANPAIHLDDFSGKRAWLGVDLASKVDIASIAILIERDDDRKFSLFVKNFLNENAVEDGRNSQYAGWALENRLIATPGNVTDFAFVEDEIRKLASHLSVESVAFDPWQASYIMQRLNDEGLPAVEYRQTVQNMSEPMKTLEAMILDKSIQHDADPVLAWMVSNVVAHTDAKENIYPRKEYPDNKIDGVVAAIMAIGRMIATTEDDGAFDEFINDPLVM